MKRAVLLLLLLSTSAAAQVGTWHTYTDMKNVRDFVIGDDGLWAASSGGVFLETDGTYTRFTNVDGLSAIDYMAISRTADGAIIAGASNGMINVREASGDWYEISDIQRATEYPSRGVTSITMHDGLAYIGTEFGVAVFDHVKREFGDTWQKFGSLRAQLPIVGMYFSGQKLWVATHEGVAVGDLNNINLKDPANWTVYTGTGSGDFGEITALSAIGGTPLLATKSKLYRFDGRQWVEFVGALPGGEVVRLREDGDEALLLMNYSLYRVRQDGGVVPIGESVNLPHYPTGTLLTDVRMDSGDIVLASNHGIARYAEGSAWDFRRPDGPNSNFIQAMAVDRNDGMLWVASGTAGGGNGIYRFDGTDWTNYSTDSHPEMKTNAVTDVAAGVNGTMWFATWGEGVLELNPNGVFTAYDHSSVPGFPGIDTDPEFEAVRSVRVDNSGGVWTLHFISPTYLLGYRSPQGAWSFVSNTVIPTPLAVTALTIDQFDQKWVLVDDPVFTGVYLLNDNYTPTVIADDTWTKLRANDANAINADADVTAVAVDLLGDVWIGTDRGLRTVFDPTQPDRVSTTCFNTRCNIEGQYVTSIAIDPVNNKWIGTKEGVFVLSADGSDILAQYDVDNSPLLDNDIQTICIHPQTGVAYIATARGLSSVVTPYVQPVAGFTDLVVSPNPFKPGLDDRVMIDGLVEGAVIKILSVSGNLVAELTSPGGRVGFWDGRTTNGEYAASGVYFVVAASPNGAETATAKLAVVKP
ncbi:hypothetical protein KQI65_03505 [bacterium]|nr:hypothetical protein [bacterium]